VISPKLVVCLISSGNAKTKKKSSHVNCFSECVSPDITEQQFQTGSYVNEDAIPPKFVGLVKEFVVENVNSVGKPTLMFSEWFLNGGFAVASGSKYMTANYEDGILRISTLEEFRNYELQETVDNMILELRFNCIGETKSLTFYQDIEIVNNYDPEFSETSYEIVIPTPLPKDLDVTLFLKVICRMQSTHSGNS
jgi:hypothetical protein